MKYLIFATLLALLAFSCQKDDDLVTAGETVNWTCGEGAAKVVHEMETSEALELSLTIEMNSLCSNTDIALLIENGEAILLKDTISAFPFSTNHSIPANSMIKITTETVDNGSLILCDRLGSATISVEF